MSSKNESLEEMQQRLMKEQKEFDRLLDQQRLFLKNTKAALVSEYGSLDKVPDKILQAFKKDEKAFEQKWGIKAKNDLKTEHQKERKDQKNQDQKAESYEEILRRQKEEFDNFPAKAYSHWQEHEKVHDGLVKEYGAWDKVPDHLKKTYKQNVAEYDKKWRQDGTELSSMLKQHQKELDDRIKQKAKALEEEWARRREQKKERKQ